VRGELCLIIIKLGQKKSQRWASVRSRSQSDTVSPKQEKTGKKTSNCVSKFFAGIKKPGFNFRRAKARVLPLTLENKGKLDAEQAVSDVKGECNSPSNDSTRSGSRKSIDTTLILNSLAKGVKTLSEDARDAAQAAQTVSAAFDEGSDAAYGLSALDAALKQETGEGVEGLTEFTPLCDIVASGSNTLSTLASLVSLAKLKTETNKLKKEVKGLEKNLSRLEDRSIAPGSERSKLLTSRATKLKTIKDNKAALVDGRLALGFSSVASVAYFAGSIAAVVPRAPEILASLCGSVVFGAAYGISKSVQLKENREDLKNITKEATNLGGQINDLRSAIVEREQEISNHSKQLKEPSTELMKLLNIEEKKEGKEFKTLSFRFDRVGQNYPNLSPDIREKIAALEAKVSEHSTPIRENLNKNINTKRMITVLSARQKSLVKFQKTNKRQNIVQNTLDITVGISAFNAGLLEVGVPINPVVGAASSVDCFAGV
jgi:cell division protein FtsB